MNRFQPLSCILERSTGSGAAGRDDRGGAGVIPIGFRCGGLQFDKGSLESFLFHRDWIPLLYAVGVSRTGDCRAKSVELKTLGFLMTAADRALPKIQHIQNPRFVVGLAGVVRLLVSASFVFPAHGGWPGDGRSDRFGWLYERRAGADLLLWMVHKRVFTYSRVSTRAWAGSQRVV